MTGTSGITIRSERATDHQSTGALAFAVFTPDVRVAELVRRKRASPTRIAELKLVAGVEGALAGRATADAARAERQGRALTR